MVFLISLVHHVSSLLDVLSTELTSQEKKIQERQKLSKAYGTARIEEGCFFNLLWVWQLIALPYFGGKGFLLLTLIVLLIQLLHKHTATHSGKQMIAKW